MSLFPPDTPEGNVLSDNATTLSLYYHSVKDGYVLIKQAITAEFPNPLYELVVRLLVENLSNLAYLKPDTVVPLRANLDFPLTMFDDVDYRYVFSGNLEVSLESVSDRGEA
jgi:hypothetical protein